MKNVLQKLKTTTLWVSLNTVAIWVSTNFYLFEIELVTIACFGICLTLSVELLVFGVWFGTFNQTKMGWVRVSRGYWPICGRLASVLSKKLFFLKKYKMWSRYVNNWLINCLNDLINYINKPFEKNSWTSINSNLPWHCIIVYYYYWKIALIITVERCIDSTACRKKEIDASIPRKHQMNMKPINILNLNTQTWTYLKKNKKTTTKRECMIWEGASSTSCKTRSYQ